MLTDLTILRVVVARLIARAGGEAAFFIGVWGMAAYTFDATSAQIAVLMATLAISSMVGAAIAGAMVDRYGPRNVIVAAQLLYIPVTLAVPLTRTIWELIAACVIFGLAHAPIMTATGSFAPYLRSQPAEIERVNALLEGTGAIAFVAGPAMGAFVAKLFSVESVFYLDAILTSLGVLLVWPVSTPGRGVHERRQPLSEVIEGVRVAYGIRPVRYYVLMGTVVWFSFGAFGALEPLFFRDVVGVGVETIGWMNSIFGAGIGLGAFLLTRMPASYTSARSLSIGVAAMALCSMIYIGTTDLRVIALGSLLWGLVTGAVEPLLRTLMQIDSPETHIGRVMGTSQLHRSAGELVPLALAPALAAVIGVQGVMIAGGALAATFALGSLGHALSLDRAGHGLHGPVSLGDAMPADEPVSPIT